MHPHNNYSFCQLRPMLPMVQLREKQEHYWVISFRALICTKRTLLTQTVTRFLFQDLSPLCTEHFEARRLPNHVGLQIQHDYSRLKITKCFNTLIAWCQKAECFGMLGLKKKSLTRQRGNFTSRYPFAFVEVLTSFSCCVV